ncbi:hypothetical protein [Methylobacterium sp. Leaf104]|uniref:hypothetical protein n=2 Tax=Methylobacterium TaxID=407 RepID=UPI001FCD6CB5|nr:hypothetical protein [Methylobacterium sp. Leaf104]
MVKDGFAHCRQPFVRHMRLMASDLEHERHRRPEEISLPTLNEAARLRLGRQLQALYEPVIDEPLDPRLAELMLQLDADRDSSAGPGRSA